MRETVELQILCSIQSVSVIFASKLQLFQLCPLPTSVFAEVIPRHLIILGDVVLWQFLQRSTCEVSRNQSKVWLNLEAGEDIGRMGEVWRAESAWQS